MTEDEKDAAARLPPGEHAERVREAVKVLNHAIAAASLAQVGVEVGQSTTGSTGGVSVIVVTVRVFQNL